MCRGNRGEDIYAEDEKLSLSEEDLRSLKTTDLRKQAVAWALNQTTQMSVQWIAQRLRMKSRSNASRNIHDFGRNENDEAFKLRTHMSKITS